MILMNAAGSMSWPVYNSDIDYAAFMKWMKDQGLAYDDDDCQHETWWGGNYDKLDPNAIYLVRGGAGHRLVEYMDSAGVPGKIRYRRCDEQNRRQFQLQRRLVA